MAGILTPKGQLSYPKVFTPELPPNPKPGQKPKYGTSIVFAPGTDLTALKQEAIRVATEKYGPKTEELIRTQQLKMPFRKDAEAKGYPAGSVFMNVRSDYKPGVVDRNVKPILDESEIYPGVIARLEVNAFCYDNSGNKGVSFGLNHVQKIADGPRLDNRKSAEETFDEVLDEEPAAIAAGAKGLTDYI
jgi:hypothetical protein